MKFKKNPTASPIFNKTSPARQDEVDPPVSEDRTSTYQEPSKIDQYNQMYNTIAPKIREDNTRKLRKGGVTTIEKKNEGLQLVFNAIKDGANESQIKKIVHEFNRDLYGTVRSGEVIPHKGWSNAKIGVKEALNYMPKTKDLNVEEKDKAPQVDKEKVDKAPSEKWDENFKVTDRQGNITGKVIQNPNYDPNFKGPVSELKERNEYILSRDVSANNPIQRAGFKKLKFGRRK
jgi:hypothetical protein|tara:strand:- start:38 stop:733 length:696 start_codon:yes stop_codon:yes gene_type:complete